MTTRNTLKRTNIGHSKSIESLMVHVSWTDAKVIRIEARQAFAMQAATVKVLRGAYEVLADVKVNVQAGQVIYFVQSDSFPNYYYVLLYSEQSNSFHCSCPAHKACSHQQHAMAFVGHRHAEKKEREIAAKVAELSQEYQEKIAPIVAARVTALIAEEQEAVRQARQEMQYQNLVA